MTILVYEGDRRLRADEGAPKEPQAGEVRIRVAYAGICGTDLHIYHGHMDARVELPHIMGHEMSGIVSAVGAGVDGCAPGDRVTVRPLDACGECPACVDGYAHVCHRLRFLGIETEGAFQSEWIVPAKTLHKLPDALPLKRAAMIEPLAVACHDVRLGEVQAGEYVVVLGGGPIGLLIALVARQAGAQVLVSEINPFRLRMASELGLDVVNPKEQDVEALVRRQTEGRGADAVFEVTSSAAGAELMTRLPRTRGRIVVVGIFNHKPQIDLHRFFWRELKLCGARVYEYEDFETAIRLAAEDALPLERLITHTYPLAQAELGFRQMESGGDAMKVMLACGGEQ